MITLETTGLLFCLLAIALIAYAMFDIARNYDVQRRIGGLLSIAMRYDISMALAFFSAGLVFQFAGSAGAVAPAVAGFSALAGVFLYMIFLGERGLLVERAIDDYESRKNSKRRK